jgi:molybdopterin converting factor small subunit
MTAAAPSVVTVHVLLFASYADTLGVDAVDLTLPAGSTIGTVIERLRALPGGDQLPLKPLCARNLAHARATDPLAGGDEIAILPPLAGG